ncbi:hypothetical protein LDJ79_12705 [Vibrio tritonius]|uniref:HEAT repeat domain-containing protein n=1 Tax=Vibrio tritonius TaxID=1435069 RepID=A0ABS7YNN9_9VIBR|nr:hypothetical protein [Vibrio tritonius]MCA2016978.1 hypothetical protein [Vibrio tritonius]
MQQGLLYSFLLSLALYTGSVSAVDMSTTEQQKLLQDVTLQHKVEQLYDYAIQDNIDALSFALQRLALPQQEAARFLLFQKMEQQNLSLSSLLVDFVQLQNRILPVYQITEKGDGYEFSVPAFNYSSIGLRLLKHWKRDQRAVDFVLTAEMKDLNLKQWLSGPNRISHEKLLIEDLDKLSVAAIQGLVDQLTSVKVTSWLPSSAVMVRLAQISHNQDIYKLLWLMRSDSAIEAELERLSSRKDPFAISQLMLAAQNPRLKDQAIRALAQVDPMSDEVKQFLVDRLSDDNDVVSVARTLVEHGRQNWLQELLNSNKHVKATAIMQALNR